MRGRSRYHQGFHLNTVPGERIEMRQTLSMGRFTTR
jgi:hypothetical protein